MKRILGLIMIIFGTIVTSSTFANEINQYNIIYPPYNCGTSATGCDLWYKEISNIAANTFINHTNFTIIY